MALGEVEDFSGLRKVEDFSGLRKVVDFSGFSGGCRFQWP